jgi:hypothetical protein
MSQSIEAYKGKADCCPLLQADLNETKTDEPTKCTSATYKLTQMYISDILMSNQS